MVENNRVNCFQTGMHKIGECNRPREKLSFKEQMHQAREEAILQATCRLLGEKATTMP